jgi:glycosyltransferase involved in cell wall biosynthesis/O-antigen ligase
MSSAGSAPYLRLRIAFLCAAALVAILAGSGALASAGFSQPTTIKYLVTVAGSIALVLAASARVPLRALVGMAILVAPFNFVTMIAGMHITPLIAVDMLAVLLWVPRSGTTGPSVLRWMVLVFALAMVPGIVGSSAPGMWLVWLAVTVATGCLTFAAAREPGGVTFVVWMIVLSGLIQCAFAIWELRSGHKLNLYRQSGTVPIGSQYFFTYGKQARPSGALPDPIGLGQVLALCLPLAAALGAQVRDWKRSAIVIALAGVIATVLVLSLSRMSLIGGVFGVAVVIALLPRQRMVRTGLMVAATVGAVTAVTLTTNGHAISRRVSSIFNPTAVHVYTAPGDLTRARIWRAALKTAEANLMTGVGFGNVTEYLPKYGVPVTSSAHTHDTYLQFLSEGGILALLGLLGVVGAAGVDLLRSFRGSRIWVAGAAGSLVATLLSWITDVEVRYAQVSAMVAILLGLIAALAARQGEAGAREDAGPVTGEPASAPDSPAGVTDWARPAPSVPAGRPSGVVAHASVPRPQTLAMAFVSHEDGGAERYVRVVAEGALARRWSVRAAFPALPATAILRDDLLAIGVRCHPLAVDAEPPHSAAHAIRLAAAEARATHRWLREIRPTATLAMLPHPDQSPGIVLATAMYPAASVASVQLVPDGLRLTRERRALYGLCRRLGQQWLAMSRDNRGRLSAALGWRAEAIAVIHNGVPASRAGASAEDRIRARLEVRQELDLEPDAKLLVTVGRLNRQKGHDLIAGSISEVISEQPDAYWLWAGEGPAEASLQSQLATLGMSDRVRMLGYRHDVPRLLAAGDVFVLTSRYEGAPFALLDAIAAGLPVIVSHAGAFGEIVRDGVEGRVVAIEGSGELAAAACWALEHPVELEVMAKAAKQRVLTEFSQERMVEQTLALLADGASLRQRVSPRTFVRMPRGSVRRHGAT